MPRRKSRRRQQDRNRLTQTRRGFCLHRARDPKTGSRGGREGVAGSLRPVPGRSRAGAGSVFPKQNAGWGAREGTPRLHGEPLRPAPHGPARSPPCQSSPPRWRSTPQQTSDPLQGWVGSFRKGPGWWGACHNHSALSSTQTQPQALPRQGGVVTANKTLFTKSGSRQVWPSS